MQCKTMLCVWLPLVGSYDHIPANLHAPVAWQLAGQPPAPFGHWLAGLVLEGSALATPNRKFDCTQRGFIPASPLPFTHPCRYPCSPSMQTQVPFLVGNGCYAMVLKDSMFNSWHLYE